MSREHHLFLDDMRKACEKIVRHTRALTRDQFIADDTVFDAVMRNLEILGEAAKHIPQDICEQYPKIEWRRIASLRDVVIHEYFGIDIDIVWDVVANKVPALLRQLEDIH